MHLKFGFSTIFCYGSTHPLYWFVLTGLWGRMEVLQAGSDPHAAIQVHTHTHGQLTQTNKPWEEAGVSVGDTKC